MQRRPRPSASPGSTPLAVVVVLALFMAACGEPGRNDDRADEPRQVVRLLAHDSFNVSDDVLEAFEADSGIDVEILLGGDANTVVNQAILTKGNPQADVLFGIDNSMITRAFDEDLFIPYASPLLDSVGAQFQLDPDHRVTPVDYGDVCLNYDREYFEAERTPVPETLEDLTASEYRGSLVVQNPTTSSPGLAFLLATIEVFGEGGWQDYWRALQDNDVTVADSWEQAYFDLFSGGSAAGDRPLVVSYASSPPFEVEDPETTPAEEAPTGVIPASCYRQIEFAGILRGTERQEAAQQVVDFLLSVPFQNDVPDSMYVYPVNEQATLPEMFTKYSVVVDDPLEMSSEQVAANRDRWLEEWTRLVR
jgi:thiamine transport system substrate-binding protein